MFPLLFTLAGNLCRHSCPLLNQVVKTANDCVCPYVQVVTCQQALQALAGQLQQLQLGAAQLGTQAVTAGKCPAQLLSGMRCVHRLYLGW